MLYRGRFGSCFRMGSSFSKRCNKSKSSLSGGGGGGGGGGSISASTSRSSGLFIELIDIDCLKSKMKMKKKRKLIKRSLSCPSVGEATLQQVLSTEPEFPATRGRLLESRSLKIMSLQDWMLASPVTVAESIESRRLKIESLEDCILASPGTDPDCFKGGELYVFGQINDRFSSYARASPGFSSTEQRESFHPMKIEEEEEEEEKEEEEYFSIAVVCKAGDSMKLKKKKVSFRLPEESDIIVFYSPKKD